MPQYIRLKRPEWLKAITLALVVTGVLIFSLSTIHTSPHSNSKIARDIHEELSPNITQHKLTYSGHDEPHSNLTTRATSWEDKVYKGHWLACLMNAADPSYVEQSHFTTNADLVQNGWPADMTELQAASQNPINLRGYTPALRALGLDTNFEHWITVTARHPASGGQYTNAYNPWGGILVGDSNHGPDFIIKERTRLGEPVGAASALKNWSDVVFLIWAKLCRRSSIMQDPRGLQHIFRSIVVNKETTETLRQAKGGGSTAGVPKFPPKWPGWSWNIDTDGGRAALSSPNGVGVAYFLFQHKEALGVKVVDRIHAFDCPDYTGASKWCMYLHVVAGPIDNI